MTATERMRELLDEREVPWKDYGYENHTWWGEWHAEDRPSVNGLFLKVEGVVTPEQAVAATLGAVEYRKPTTLSQLEAENAKLREQMERLVTLLRNDCDIDASWDGLRGFWLIGLTENGCLMRDRACKAEAENAKLRELVRDMMVAWWACDNERCPRHDERCEEGRFCAFDECARDLGIEVGE